jgi:hypothetical protein
MKNKLPFTLAYIVLFGLCVTFVAPLSAQDVSRAPHAPVLQETPTPEATVTAEQVGDVVGFELLGFSEQVLRGPAASTRLLFGLPATWQVGDNAEIQLNVATFIDETTATTLPLNDSSSRRGRVVVSPSATLSVVMNGVQLAVFSIEQTEERTLTFPILPEALVSPRGDGRHELRIILREDDTCDFVRQTSVAIRESSRLILPHTIIPPSTDLTLLPRPLFQQSFLPDIATIVVADKPSVEEMQAALTVAASFGRMTDNRMQVSLKPLSQVTDDVRKAEHLIFVGTAANFPALRDVELPSPIINGGFKPDGAQPSDGVVQMAVSPWNPANVVLIVSGNEGVGVGKAARAVSTATVRPTGRSDLALVADVLPRTIGETQLMVDRTFADLGYSTQLLGQAGPYTAEYRFYVPPGHEVEAEAYVNLFFNHSSLLNYERSAMTVMLNTDMIGSVRFSDQTASVSDVRLTIPRAALRTGINRLIIRADLSAILACADPRQQDLWMNIWPESSLHLPLVPAQEDGPQVFDLSAYPDPYALNPTLEDTGVIVEANDPVAWNVAARLLADLGNQTEGIVVGVDVVYSDAVPDQLKSERNLLIVGRASKLPIIGELNDLLPASFDPGSDIATEKSSRVVYRVPPGTDIGYVQLIQSPWNPQRAVMAVLGSSDQGLEWAGAALWKGGLRSKLLGSFAAVKDEQITISDIQPNMAAQATASATADAQTQATATAAPADATPAAAAPVAQDPAAGVAASSVPTSEDSFPVLPFMLSLFAIAGLLGYFIWRRYRAAA